MLITLFLFIANLIYRRSEENRKKSGTNRKKTGKSLLKGKGAAKPKGGKGQRNPKRHSAGRKRR